MYSPTLKYPGVFLARAARTPSPHSLYAPVRRAAPSHMPHPFPAPSVPCATAPCSGRRALPPCLLQGAEKRKQAPRRCSPLNLTLILPPRFSRGERPCPPHLRPPPHSMPS